jgi:hypothetical protein
MRSRDNESIRIHFAFAHLEVPVGYGIIVTKMLGVFESITIEPP